MSLPVRLLPSRYQLDCVIRFRRQLSRTSLFEIESSFRFGAAMLRCDGYRMQTREAGSGSTEVVSDTTARIQTDVTIHLSRNLPRDADMIRMILIDIEYVRRT